MEVTLGVLGTYTGFGVCHTDGCGAGVLLARVGRDGAGQPEVQRTVPYKENLVLKSHGFLKCCQAAR